MFQSQAVDLFVPGQLFQQVIRLGDGVVAEKLYDPGSESQINRPSVFPVPDRWSRDVEPGSDIFLVQSKLNSTSPQVIAKGDWFAGEFFKWLNRKRYFHFSCSLIKL